MSDFRPFKGLRFTRDVEPKLAPPYDVISPEDREQLGSDPENIVHLTLPPGASGQRDYALARRTLADWIEKGILARDEAERFYVLQERTTDGRTRRGFIGLLRLADYEERVVLPHEQTMPGPKRDRLLLTREVRANLEPLFFLYEDRDARLDAALDAAVASDMLVGATGPDGTGLELFALDDPGLIEQVRGFLAGLPVVIADGHHRYETMRTYRDECRESGSSDGEDAAPELVLGYLVNAFDPGSAVRAIHRVLRGQVAELDSVLGGAGFTQRQIESMEADPLLAFLAEQSREQHAFVFARPGGELVLATRAKGETLAVEVLHGEILSVLGGELSFDARPARLLKTMRDGGASLGIFLNPTDPDDLFRVVQEGKVLPSKSTFFTPKIPSGLVLRDF
jgi:uncharacterized protein (DUF1015 family)